MESHCVCIKWLREYTTQAITLCVYQSEAPPLPSAWAKAGNLRWERGCLCKTVQGWGFYHSIVSAHCFKVAEKCEFEAWLRTGLLFEDQYQSPSMAIQGRQSFILIDTVTKKFVCQQIVVLRQLFAGREPAKMCLVLANLSYCVAHTLYPNRGAIRTCNQTWE